MHFRLLISGSPPFLCLPSRFRCSDDMPWWLPAPGRDRLLNTVLRLSTTHQLAEPSLFPSDRDDSPQEKLPGPLPPGPLPTFLGQELKGEGPSPGAFRPSRKGFNVEKDSAQHLTGDDLLPPSTRPFKDTAFLRRSRETSRFLRTFPASPLRNPLTFF